MTSNIGLGLLVATLLCGCAYTAGGPTDAASPARRTSLHSVGTNPGWSVSVDRAARDEAEALGPSLPWPADASVPETPPAAAATVLETGSLATAATQTRAPVPAPAASAGTGKSGPTIVVATAPRVTVAAETTSARAAKAGLQAGDYIAEMNRVAIAMVAASKEAYRRDSGPCACPEDRDQRGDPCGERSAYHGPELLRPLCRASDVTPDMIVDYMRTGSLIFAAR